MAMTLLSGGGSTFNASTAMGSIMAMARAPQTLQGFGFGGQNLINTKAKQQGDPAYDNASNNKIANSSSPDVGYNYNNKENLSAQNMASKLDNKNSNKTKMT